MTTTKSSRFTHFDELLAVRMGAPEFALSESATTQSGGDITGVSVDQLIDLGFIFSHGLTVTNAVGKDEGEISNVIVYIKADVNAYALITNLFHEEYWVHFTSIFNDGSRFVTTSQPGVLALEQLPESNRSYRLQNVGTTTIAAQWKRHNRFIATEVPDKSPMLLKPAQHVELEREFYQEYVSNLLQQNILQQSDTQTIKFTRSGARNFHLALTTRSATKPALPAEKWIGKKKPVPTSPLISFRTLALTASAVIGIGIVVFLLQGREPASSSGDEGLAATNEVNNTSAVSSPTADTTLSMQLPDLDAIPHSSQSPDNKTGRPEADRQNFLVADQEDEMWRIAVENAEFFLLSNDGDPAPWVRTARKIAAGFPSGDSRLARTYFLTALLEPDYRVAEQQFNRALSIQTKTLGLYHAETAQTLEALAWIAEHNKDDLDEAITHQRLAINIYHDIFGPDAEDTKAAEWKLTYFEDRLQGVRPKSDSNRRLLPALARFSR